MSMPLERSILCLDVLEQTPRLGQWTYPSLWGASLCVYNSLIHSVSCVQSQDPGYKGFIYAPCTQKSRANHVRLDTRVPWYFATSFRAITEFGRRSADRPDQARLRLLWSDLWPTLASSSNLKENRPPELIGTACGVESLYIWVARLPSRPLNPI
jgi:hypothetical protein